MWDSHYEDSAAIGPASSVDFFSGDMLTYPVPANAGYLRLVMLNGIIQGEHDVKWRD